MAFCSQCGKEIKEEDHFCPYCGAKREAAPPLGIDTRDAEDNKVMGILAYLGILVLVPILAAKDSKFARYHANQGLVLLLAEVIGGIVLAAITGIFNVLPYGFPLFILRAIPSLIAIAFQLLCLLMTVLGIINAAKGEKKELPVIGHISLLK